MGVPGGEQQGSRKLYAPWHWPAWVAVGALRCVALLPLSWQRPLGAGLGRCLYLLQPHRRHVADRNLAACFPALHSAQRRRLLRAVFRSCGMGILESACGWWEGSRMTPLLELHGAHYLRQARQEGRGVLLLSAHYTGLDLCAYFVSTIEPLHWVYRRQTNPVFDWMMRNGRARFSLSLLERGQVQRLVRLLREGAVVGYLADQDYGPRHSVFADFFGVPAATITAVSRIARLSGAAVIFAAYQRKASGGYRMDLLPAPKDFTATDTVRDAQCLNQLLEETLEPHPEQYLWIHRRFKTRPEGSAPLYKKSKWRSFRHHRRRARRTRQSS